MVFRPGRRRTRGGSIKKGAKAGIVVFYCKYTYTKEEKEDGQKVTEEYYSTAFQEPHHALDSYLPRLIRAGKRIAICDQLEDPRLTKKLVKRGTTELMKRRAQ